jgi:hypothetical protein
LDSALESLYGGYLNGEKLPNRKVVVNLEHDGSIVAREVALPPAEHISFSLTSSEELRYYFRKEYLTIENVIFNDPATIVFWKDGSKTVVKCQPGDTFNPELGLAMAIAKRVYGPGGRYNEIFKKWVPQNG